MEANCCNTYIDTEIPNKNISDIINFKIDSEDLPQLDSSWATYHSRQDEFERKFLVEGKWCLKTYEEDRVNEGHFRICAGAQMFDMTRMSVADGYKIVLDPIVLQPVQGGYLIVTAWGDEAVDQKVTNERMN